MHLHKSSPIDRTARRFIQNCGVLIFYEAGTKTRLIQSRFTDGLFWMVGEALVKIISNHGGTFIISNLLSLPPCQIMTVLENQRVTFIYTLHWGQTVFSFMLFHGCNVEEISVSLPSLLSLFTPLFSCPAL